MIVGEGLDGLQQLEEPEEAGQDVRSRCPIRDVDELAGSQRLRMGE